ncbi:stimulator of interferon genes protein homolog [Musca vetustissima]|uniref:stimulator of interferon genes protein homolog n=1 Tax=Musca vetustissima TaxID=27455 RepID=UPI002AB6329F|nr:stimulator of interferon genes protein homolog [Musca vetustissima]
MEEYIDTCIRILAVALLAELCVRIFRYGHEILFYSNYYDVDGGAKYWQVARRCFSLNIPTIVFILLFVFGALIRFAMAKEFVLPPLKWLAFMPLYWLLVWVGLSFSHLDYANFVRQSHGLDYAEGMASNYFHGYLKLTLPSHTGHPGLKERIEQYEAKEHVEFAVKRLIILVPNTMFINSKIESRILTKDGPLETVVKNRAGVERPFKNDVYRFTVPINGTYYYVAVEGATPMLSFFEAMSYHPSTTWQMKEMKREILLKFYKHLKKLLKEWPPTEDEAELVLYNAYQNDGRPQDVGDVLLSHITNMWNEHRR